MTKAEFAATLQGAVAGKHEDLEKILRLYEPLIRKYSGSNDELHQYLLIHVALNINKFPL